MLLTTGNISTNEGLGKPRRSMSDIINIFFRILFFYFHQNMTINPSAESFNTNDLFNGAVSDYYNDIDNGLEPSEVRPGEYKNIVAPSYSSACPVKTPGYTTFDIGVNDPETVMIDKSYIRLKIRAKIQNSGAFTLAGDDYTKNPQCMFFGFGESIEAISRYDILHNGKVLYTQTFVGEESFIRRSIKRDDVRERKPHESTTYKNASTLNENICGQHVLFNATAAGSTTEISFYVKIPLTSFPIFQDFKYLPGWMGNWSIRLWAGSINMVFCQVNPEYTIGRKATDELAGSLDWSQEFNQIGDEVKVISNYESASHAITTTKMRFECIDYVFEEANISITTQQMYLEVYNQIKYKYMTKPLSIPFLQFQFAKFNGSSNNKSAQNYNYNGLIRCCECLFILPFANVNHHTICRNPNYKGLYLNVSPYGNYPNNPIDTFEGEEGNERYIDFLNLTLDALNIDNSPVVAMNEDLNNSLRGKNKYITVSSAAGKPTRKTIEVPGDKTNFFVGFPFSDDADFQGGLTSPGNTQIKLNAAYADFGEVDMAPLQPTGMFVLDNIVMIAPSNTGPPNCVIVDEKIY